VKLATCEFCGKPFKRTRARMSRCTTCDPGGRVMRSPTTRAQDAEYHAERRRVLAGDPPCHWCGQPAKTADHVIPVARGGGHVGNLVPCCQGCNARKGAKTPDVLQH